MYRKLRKNLGAKNCEFAPAHIQEIVDVYLAMERRERGADDEGIAGQVFENADFGYYKVTIERPDRRKARFDAERIETLRFDRVLRAPMEWVYRQWGDAVCESGVLAENQKAILDWCEKNELALNLKNRKKLLNPAVWRKHWELVRTAEILMADIGDGEFDDFNRFRKRVDAALKARKIKLSPPDKKAILNAMSWYDEGAARVIRKKERLSGEKLSALLDRLGCGEADLPDFGYYPTEKKGEYLTYEPCPDLRDFESVPLKDDIHRYFLAEVKPHVAEAWINLDSVKIGCEISFNKYFYRHKPLRSMEEVAADIVALEKKAEGLIADILGVEVEDVSGVDQ
jgi:type I restriction enzyme M protein